MGHAKHRKSGKTPKGAYTKLRMQMDANKPPGPKRPKGKMYETVRDALRER